MLTFFDGISHPLPAIENVDIWKISELRSLWQRQDHRRWWRNRSNIVRCWGDSGSLVWGRCESTNACRLGVCIAASIKHAGQGFIGDDADRPGGLDGRIEEQGAGGPFRSVSHGDRKGHGHEAGHQDQEDKNPLPSIRLNGLHWSLTP